MNTSHLLDPILQGKIKVIWASKELLSTKQGEPPSTLLNKGLTKASKIVREWGREKVAARKKIEQDLCLTLANYQSAL